ncbi:MAG TPA: glutaredoxin family protein [Thermoanaerobaculia bacterium]
MADIKIYGADWCGDTRRAKRHLDKQGIPYDFVDVDQDQDAEQKVIAFSKGKRRIPLIEIATEKGTQSLAVPSESELDNALK